MAPTSGGGLAARVLLLGEALPGAAAELGSRLVGRGARSAAPRALPALGDPAERGVAGGLEWLVGPRPGQPLPELLDDLRAVVAGAAPGPRAEVVVTDRRAGLPRLVVLDVDSTLITGEVVEMLAARAGVEDEVARVTEAAMRGEVDFTGSLHRRVALLEGLPVEVLDEVRAEVVPSPGAAAMARCLADAGVPVGVVSGGFAEVVEPLAASLGIPAARANRLEAVGGRLTGRVLGDVVDAPAKEVFLRELAERHDVPLEGTVAVGDGANDLAMVRAAGTGVAFCAKPVLEAAADVVLRRRDLTAVAHLVGVA